MFKIKDKYFHLCLSKNKSHREDAKKLVLKITTRSICDFMYNEIYDVIVEQMEVRFRDLKVEDYLILKTFNQKRLNSSINCFRHWNWHILFCKIENRSSWSDFRIMNFLNKPNLAEGSFSRNLYTLDPSS